MQNALEHGDVRAQKRGHAVIDGAVECGACLLRRNFVQSDDLHHCSAYLDVEKVQLLRAAFRRCGVEQLIDDAQHVVGTLKTCRHAFLRIDRQVLKRQQFRVSENAIQRGAQFV